MGQGIQDLQRRGITLVSVAEPDLCSTDPTRKLMRQIMGAIAEYDKAMVVLKLRGARQRAKAKTGRCEGAKPYGTKAGESDVLDRMRTLRMSGVSFQEIAAVLNEDGMAPRRGSKWHPYAVGRILARGSEHGPQERIPALHC